MPDQEPGAGPPLRVLVVDDETVNLDTFRRVFRRDYDMAFADSAAKAIEALSSERFDALITDFSMPVTDGVELIHQAKALHPELCCLIVTGFADTPKVREANARGWASVVIAKPWERDEILRWVRLVTQLSRARHRAATDPP